ncbi:MAG: hypothetical protein JXA46_05010 [Dehalococcoidales bacterium]|nr:hypothetical protein [Dehalococcoidales bacterium]
MKKIWILVLIAVCLTSLAMGTAAQAASSSYLRHTFYGSDLGERAYSVAIDSEDNSIITGRGYNTWNGPDDQPPIIDHAGPGAADVFVLKLDDEGGYLWHSFFGTDLTQNCAEPADYGMGVAVDGDDNIYVTGFSAATWDGPAGQKPLNAHSQGIGDLFVLKLNPSGAYQWHTFFGSATTNADYRDEGHAIILDSSNNIYVAFKSGESWNGPPSQAPKNAFSGMKDMGVLKLNSAGAYQWHTFFGSEMNDDTNSIYLNGSYLYVAGTSGADWGTNPFHVYQGDNDIVVIQLSTSGDYQWHTFFGSSANDGANGITGSDNDLYITGYSNGIWYGPRAASPKNGYSGAADITVLKLDTAGAYGWHAFYGSDTEDDFGRGIDINSSGSEIYVTGRSGASWSNPQSPVHAYAGDEDLLIMELASDGAYQWHTFYGCTDRDRGQDIAVDSRGYLHSVGSSQATWNGDDDTSPLHEYTALEDILEVVLGEETEDNTPEIYRVGGEVQSINGPSLMHHPVTSSQMSVFWIALPVVLAAGGTFLVLKRRTKH